MRDKQEVEGETPLFGSSVDYFSWDFRREKKTSPLIICLLTTFLCFTFFALASPLSPPPQFPPFFRCSLKMSHTGTFRGTPNKTIGRGRLPDFDGSSSNASHIPRPRPDRPEPSSTHTPASDVGSGTGTMSAASSRQRQTQSKRDEVRDQLTCIVPKTCCVLPLFLSSSFHAWICSKSVEIFQV